MDLFCNFPLVSSSTRCRVTEGYVSVSACMRVRACGGVCTYVFCLELTRNKNSVISHFNNISSDNRMYISGNVGLWYKFEFFSNFPHRRPVLPRQF